MMELTQSLEDYLEAIWIISLKKKVVRVKDLMKHFGYKVSSVNYALNVLASKKLVEHEKYGYIDLTYKGGLIAREIYEKHKNLTKFFTQILGVTEDVASKDACNLEHYISKETYERMIKLSDYVQTIDSNVNFLEGYEKFLKNKNKTNNDNLILLSNLNKGEKGIIKKINAPTSIKQKLLSMGLSTNEKCTVEKTAPFGGPIEIKIKGYHLSLRKEEAQMVIIEKEKK